MPSLTLNPGARSLDRVTEWSGDITEKEGLMAAVQARGLVHGEGERPEVILVLGGGGELPAALNLHLGLRKVHAPKASNLKILETHGAGVRPERF